MTHTSRSKQRGVFTVITALGAVLLVLVLGLVVDGSRLMVVQGELQTAADACALSAAAELNGLPDASQRAVDAGLLMAKKNMHDFQSSLSTVLPDDLRLSSSVDGTYAVVDSTDTRDYRFVECTTKHTALNVFMGLTGLGSSMLAATSRAGQQKTRHVCSLPIGLMPNPIVSSAEAPDFGYELGEVVTEQLRYVDLFENRLTGSDSGYSSLVTQSGVCGVPASFPRDIGIDGSNAMATSLNSALKTRYETDGIRGNGPGFSNRRWMAVPVVSASSTDSATVQGWACLELGPGGSVFYRGDALKLTGSVPSSNCVSMGTGGGGAQGPYAPTLVK